MHNIPAVHTLSSNDHKVKNAFKAHLHVSLTFLLLVKNTIKEI